MVWLPAIRAGSGADVFTRRLAAGLEQHGLRTRISWFDHRFELAPFLLSRATPPPGTGIIFANSWTAFAFRRAGIPLVATEHGCVFDPEFRPHQSPLQAVYHRGLIRRYCLRSYAAADAVTAVSHYTAASLARACGLSGVEVLPNWIDGQRFRPPAAPRPRAAAPFRLLFVGNLSRRKGADLLPAIMRELGPEFELRYASGRTRPVWRDVPANMQDLGHLDLDALVPEYQTADALLCPSRYEGFGYVAAEAMACGLPVIAAAAGALPEVLGEEEGGVLCPPGVVSGFVAAARALRASPERCDRLAATGRARVERCYVESVALPRYLALIERLLAPASAAA